MVPLTTKFTDAQELEEFLVQYSVPVHEFGQGRAKTTNQLLKEINVGECNLLYDDKFLIRFFMNSTVYVYHDAYKLWEDRQEFGDGRVRRRGFDFVAEKVPFTEHPDEAAVRCLVEELGVTGVAPTYLGEELRANLDSMSYPGIMTLAKSFYYEVELPADHYDPEGYVEEQEDKTNFYIWRVDRTRL